MSRTILLIALLAFFGTFALSAQAGIWEKLYKNLDYAYISHNNGNYNVRLGFNTNAHSHYIKPSHVYAYHVARSSSPTIRSLPESYPTYYNASPPPYYPSNYAYSGCTFISKSPPGGISRIRQGYYVCP